MDFVENSRIANEEVQVSVDRKQLHDEDTLPSFNPLANVFKPKLRLNSIKRLLIKKLSNNTCKINNEAELSGFDSFEESITVSTDECHAKLNNMQRYCDHTSCSLNPNAIMLTHKKTRFYSSQ